MPFSNPCCSPSAGGTFPGTAGRTTREPPRNYWPDHDMKVLTNFISERNRIATMWKL